MIRSGIYFQRWNRLISKYLSIQSIMYLSSGYRTFSIRNPLCRKGKPICKIGCRTETSYLISHLQRIPRLRAWYFNVLYLKVILNVMNNIHLNAKSHTHTHKQNDTTYYKHQATLITVWYRSWLVTFVKCVQSSPGITFSLYTRVHSKTNSYSLSHFLFR